MRSSFLLAPLLLASCAEAYDPRPTVSPAPPMVAPSVNYSVTVNEGAATATASAPDRGTSDSRVLILQSTHLDRPAEVVGIVDVHEEMGHHDDALDALRHKAAAMGADAVVGVEFHHSEGGEPTHLSGLAVRFVSGAP